MRGLTHCLVPVEGVAVGLPEQQTVVRFVVASSYVSLPTLFVSCIFFRPACDNILPVISKRRQLDSNEDVLCLYNFACANAHFTRKEKHSQTGFSQQ